MLNDLKAHVPVSLAFKEGKRSNELSIGYVNDMQHANPPSMMNGWMLPWPSPISVLLLLIHMCFR